MPAVADAPPRQKGRLNFSRIASGLPLWLALGVCLSVSALTWFGYRAMQEWQASSALLATRRTEETAELFVRAVARDMQGVQKSVLVSANWSEYMLDAPNDLRSFVAAAFARYPYPETFFAARLPSDSATFLFFNRADRRPAWLQTDVSSGRFPVRIDRSAAVAQELIKRMAPDVAVGRLFSVFAMVRNGATYQVVVRLLYRDPLRERLAGVFGFVVNLDWASRQYFTDLTRQVARTGSVREGFVLRIFDDRGRRIATSAPQSRGGSIIRRPFPLAFFDPGLVTLDPSSDRTSSDWMVEVEDVSDLAPVVLRQGASRTLVISALSAVTLALGLVLTARATRAHAELSEMRSQFVSTVTHELKTPIATIRAIGDTLISGRSNRPNATLHYAHLIVQESKRLSRLVDNLLAYARIVDVTDVYTRERLSVSEVINQTVRRFDAQLTAKAFDIRVDIEDAIPPILADAVAIELLFDNVIDNAIRYSVVHRALTITARKRESVVVVDITDRGMGIPPEELARVTRRFYRGRHAGSSGSGLGLAIADRIATDHGGHLAIQSVVESGTTVTVSLPLAAAL